MCYHVLHEGRKVDGGSSGASAKSEQVPAPSRARRDPRSDRSWKGGRGLGPSSAAVQSARATLGVWASRATGGGSDGPPSSEGTELHAPQRRPARGAGRASRAMLYPHSWAILTLVPPEPEKAGLVEALRSDPHAISSAL